MTEMIERVARALYARHTEQGVHVYPAWEDAKEWIREIDRQNARAAIAAMREPTQEMAREGDLTLDPYGNNLTPAAPHAWRTMIDTALGAAPKDGLSSGSYRTVLRDTTGVELQAGEPEDPPARDA